MSSTTSLTDYYSNLERISPYSLEEYNKLLEENGPYSRSTFKEISPTTIETFTNTFLDYNIDLKLLICSKCSTTLNNNLESIKKHLKVSNTSSIKVLY